MESNNIDQVSKEILRQMLNLQLQLSDTWKNQEKRVRTTLLNLAANCIPSYLEQCMKSGKALENQQIDVLTSNLSLQIIDQFQELISINNRYEYKRIPELMHTLQNQKAELDKLNAENIALKKLHLTTQNSDMKGLDVNKVSIPAEEVHRQLKIFSSSDTFQRDQEALKIIGENGYSRIPVIKEKLAKTWNVATAKARSIDECLNRLSHHSLIIIEQKTQQEQTSYGGRYPHILNFTPTGSAIFEELFQSPPQGGLYDRLLKRHKSPEHTLLIMHVADLFESVGYTVERFPNRYKLDNGHFAEPDLLFSGKDQKEKLLEVERGGNKSNRTNKWLNLYHVGQKTIFVITDNKKAMVQIRSEIAKALGTRQGVTYLSNMFELLKGERGSENSIWLDIRER